MYELPEPGVHVPFRHGLLEQPVTCVWQLAPVHPAAQEHVYALPLPAAQVPPFWHGLGAHGST